MSLSLTKASQTLLKDDPAFLLIRYIFGTQGFSLARLDYKAAAAAIGVSERTVGRIVKRLAEKKLLVISRDVLRISEDLRAE